MRLGAGSASPAVTVGSVHGNLGLTPLMLACGHGLMCLGIIPPEWIALEGLTPPQWSHVRAVWLREAPWILPPWLCLLCAAKDDTS